MKIKAYMRVAKSEREPGYRVSASSRPNLTPFETGGSWQSRAIPTAMFAIELDIPDEVLNRAEQILASLEIENAEPLVEAKEVDASS